MIKPIKYKIDEQTGCWNWLLSKNSDGYGQQGYKGKFWLAHRLAYQNNIGKIPKGLCVLHHCDNPPCVNPKHLFLGTPADNMRDRDMKGRQFDKHGENNPRAKLTQSQVLKIRELYSTKKYFQSELAKRFGVDQTTISNIKLGRSWNYL